MVATRSKIACLTGLALSLVQTALAAPSVIEKREAFPDYVLKYAPLGHLHTSEQFYPSEITTHLQHVTPEVSLATYPEIPR
jgi:hypothetical protein